MNNKEKTKLFLRFLKKNQVFHQYLRYFNSEEGTRYRKKIFPLWLNVGIETFIQKSLNNQTWNYLIANAFKWSDTDEGEVYWSNLHYQWYKINNRIVKQKQ